MAQRIISILGTAAMVVLMATGPGVASTGATPLVAAVESPSRAATHASGPITISDNLDYMAKIVSRDTGVSATEALEWVTKSNVATPVMLQAQQKLGSTYAGAYFDRHAMSLVVLTTDPSRLPDIAKLGAVPRVAGYSHQQLVNIENAVIEKSEQENSPIQTIGISARRNAVFIELTSDQKRAISPTLVASIEGFGSAVVIEDAPPGQAVLTNGPVKREDNKAPLADYNLYSGFHMTRSANADEYFCSYGVNAHDNNGNQVNLTAGHCGRPALIVWFLIGPQVGTFTQVNFRDAGENDMGTIAVRSGDWNAVPCVFDWNGGCQLVRGSALHPEGATICKSGATTEFTCGVIVALGVRQVFSDGSAVRNIIMHTACVEGGDSGGGNIAGFDAQGTTTGAFLYEGSRCGANVNPPQATRSYTFDINQGLRAYGLTVNSG